MDNKFAITMCSDFEYDDMVADLTYNNRTICTISQDKGINNMEIDIMPLRNGDKPWRLPLDDFIEKLKLTKQALVDFQKLPDD